MQTHHQQRFTEQTTHERLRPIDLHTFRPDMEATHD